MDKSRQTCQKSRFVLGTKNDKEDKILQFICHLGASYQLHPDSKLKAILDTQ